MVWRTEGVEQKKFNKPVSLNLFRSNCAILLNFFCSTARKSNSIVAFSLVLQWFGGPGVERKGRRPKVERGMGGRQKVEGRRREGGR